MYCSTKTNIYYYILQLFVHKKTVGSKEKPLVLVCFAVRFASRPQLTAASKAPATQRCAFEGELGVQAPLGFWDPAGLSSVPRSNKKAVS